MTAPEQSAEKDAVRVTCTDLKTGESESQELWDDYCLVAIGSAEVTHIQVASRALDGTATHVITVKGVRRG